MDYPRAVGRPITNAPGPQFALRWDARVPLAWCHPRWATVALAHAPTGQAGLTAVGHDIISYFPVNWSRFYNINSERILLFKYKIV